MHRTFFTLTILFCIFSCKQPVSPVPYGAIPSEGQLQWHDVDFYGMICMSTITYTDQEWGFGDEPASIFHPEEFDAKQMVADMKEAGMKGVLIVAKHHGGFCLWPTATTEYSVKSSPWRDGKGDILREFADAAHEAGLKFGVYLSPWDRNDPDYGTPIYLERYREQIRELHTNYGDIFLSWYDGANGGDGYYGGAREKREIDRSYYYDWENTWGLVRELQPNAAIFSDIGLDVRWVGNEQGIAGDPCWATYTPKAPDGGKPGCGYTKYQEAVNGHRDGKYWMPAECDVPIRPGWFYHAAEDNYVKSPETLFDLYFMSVGRGGTLDLGLAPDKRGLFHSKDRESLKGLGRLLSETFSINLATNAKLTTSQTRGNSKVFSSKRLIDNNKNTYWSTDDNITNGEIIIEFSSPTRFNIISLREYLPLGQRIDSITTEIFDGKEWLLYAKATSIGACRLIRGNPVETSKIRVQVWGPVSPALSEIGVYLEPQRINTPIVSRDIWGTVSIANLNPHMSTHYTLDGSEPVKTSEKYTSPIAMLYGGTLKLRVFDGNKAGEILQYEFGIAKSGWRIIPERRRCAAFDENPATIWTAGEKQELCIDLGNSIDISSFIYTPPVSKPDGIVSKYEIYVSDKPNQWGKAVSKGEFGNIRNNPLPQTIHFESKINGRYFRFVASETIENAPMTIAELDILMH